MEGARGVFSSLPFQQPLPLLSPKQTMRLDDSEVIVLDIRMPCVPATLLKSHESPVNTLAWAPHSACHICSGADDKRALIWDIQNIPSVGGKERGRQGRGVWVCASLTPSYPPPFSETRRAHSGLRGGRAHQPAAVVVGGARLDRHHLRRHAGDSQGLKEEEGELFRGLHRAYTLPSCMEILSQSWSGKTPPSLPSLPPLRCPAWQSRPCPR